MVDQDGFWSSTGRTRLLDIRRSFDPDRYRFTLDADRIGSLTIDVTDMEGDPSVLA